jgi:DNA repair photolyase
MHSSFKVAQENPFGTGYAIVDPSTPDRVARDARTAHQRGLIQLCTTVDAWAPEAQQYILGRRCLEAILAEPVWTVRILTKNAAVQNDFDLIAKHQPRVLVGLSLAAPPDKTQVIRAVGPLASSIPERTVALETAHRLGLRTYGMYCPLLPGIADERGPIQELISFGLRCGVEEIFVELVNGREPGLKATEGALRQAGFLREAEAIAQIRSKQGWSSYATRLFNNVQESRAEVFNALFEVSPCSLTAHRAYNSQCQRSVRGAQVHSLQAVA